VGKGAHFARRAHRDKRECTWWARRKRAFAHPTN